MTPLIAAVRAALGEVAEPERAAPMQAYMKSEMPYLGVRSAVRKKACRAAFEAHPLPDAETWRATARRMWDEAEYREQRYAAIQLTGHRRYAKAWLDLDALPLFEHFIVDGAWWDYVDEVAAHRVGVLLDRFPDEMKAVLLRWSTDDDLWRRRTSIIAQLRRRGDADLDLLYACIAPSMDSKAFFLRKGIGWALRQVAWHHPEEIVRYVRAHADRLSGLSKREALKNVRKPGMIDAIP